MSGRSFFAAGVHTLNVAEREDGTRLRRVGMSMGYPDCQFGAPTSNNTADSVYQQVLDLETNTNNRVSQLSASVASLNASLSATESMVMASISSQVSTMGSSLQSQIAAQASSTMATTSTLSTAVGSLTSRLGNVQPFGTGAGTATLPSAPQLNRALNDITLAAATTGTVRVQGSQCSSDLCALVAQVSTLTDALRQV
jgi:hypothetical protein